MKEIQKSDKILPNWFMITTLSWHDLLDQIDQKSIICYLPIFPKKVIFKASH